MIELIFVIVIIGILAAVAIPKLAATRDDAQDAKVRSNVVTCLTDFVASYTAKGTGDTATFSSSACDATDAKNIKITVTPSGNNVTINGTLSNDGIYSKNATYKGSSIVL
jgi:type II secretory pathway pseudopilin PulG